MRRYSASSHALRIVHPIRTWRACLVSSLRRRSPGRRTAPAPLAATLARATGLRQPDGRPQPDLLLEYLETPERNPIQVARIARRRKSKVGTSVNGTALTPSLFFLLRSPLLCITRRSFGTDEL